MKTPFKYPSPIVIEPLRYFGLAVSRLFWRIEYHGTENIPQNLKTGLLVAPNHQTYFDPFWVCVPIKRKYRFMAWEQAFEWFLIGDLIRYFGAFPINLERGSKEALKEALKSLRSGAALVVFPEGAREFSDGKPLPFKSGAVKIAMAAGVPILPVTIRGGNGIWAQDMKLPHPGKVEIFYHPIMEVPPAPAGGEEEHLHVKKLNEKLQEIIKSKL